MSGATALVIGGTGPTGPHVVDGLKQRGYEVTILHRGTHELPELDGLEHIHADPHFEETLREALAGRSFDVVLGMYGRLRAVVNVVANRCGTFIGVTGAPAYAGYFEPDCRWPQGMPVGTEESDSATAAGGDAVGSFTNKLRAAERAVLDLHHAGAFRAALFRYPSIYGPRQLVPKEWSVVRRIHDGRSTIILPDGGLTIGMRCAARNAAEFLLTGVDRIDAAAGEIFNVGDKQQLTLRQWTQLVARAAGRDLEIISLPFEYAGPGRAFFPVPHTDHIFLSIDKASRLLGYVEAVDAYTAVQESGRWYSQNPPAQQVQDRMVDTFDYEAEDAVVAAYRAAMSELAALQPDAKPHSHPYAHPKKPGAVDHQGR